MGTHHIDERIRRDLRYFAYWLGNGTLLPRNEGVNVDYSYVLLSDTNKIGCIFAIYINNLKKELDTENDVDATDRSARWLVNQCDPHQIIYPPLQLWELVAEDGCNDAFEAVKRFGVILGVNEFPSDIIGRVDYLSILFEGGSFLEEIMAVFSNNLLTDANGKIVNFEYAVRRASQYIRGYRDSDYVVVPPFERWEVESIE